MISGETVLSGAPDPGTPMNVLRTPAGFYVGYLDQDGLPYSRETDYFESEEQAGAALTEIEATRLRGDDPRILQFVR